MSAVSSTEPMTAIQTLRLGLLVSRANSTSHGGAGQRRRVEGTKQPSRADDRADAREQQTHHSDVATQTGVRPPIRTGRPALRRDCFRYPPTRPAEHPSERSAGFGRVDGFGRCRGGGFLPNDSPARAGATVRRNVNPHDLDWCPSDLLWYFRSESHPTRERPART